MTRTGGYDQRRKTSEPLVSVVIPAYNAARFIQDTLESALAQTYPHVEVIVVDDGSTDETVDILRGYGSRIRSIRQDNQGVSVARNRGIAAARGELIAFLDADDVWLPEKLTLQVAEHAIHPEAGLITCGTYYIDEHGKVFDERKPNDFRDRQHTFHAFLIRNMIYGGPSTVVVPRRCLDAVGDFDAALPPTEDRDLWIRLAQRFIVRALDRPLSRYRLHPHNSHKNIERMMRSREMTIDRHRSSMGWLSFQKARSFVHADAAGAYYDTDRRAPAFWHAVRAIWWYPLRVWHQDEKYAVAIKSALPRWVLGAVRSLRRRFRARAVSP